MKDSGEITYHDVYLTELGALVRLYRQRIESETNIQKPPIPITEGFGLPLVLAKKDKQILGFASVTFNPANAPEFNSYAANGLNQTLLEKAKTVFEERFDQDSESHIRLKAAVLKLVKWLNDCI